MVLPCWWHWDLVFSAHAEFRMEERGVSELQLRTALEDVKRLERLGPTGRWLVRLRLGGPVWIVVLEPDTQDEVIVVVTVYREPEL